MPDSLYMPVQLRFGDMDAYGHVNNVVYLQYFENARVQLAHAPLDEVVLPADRAGQTFDDLVGPERFTLVGRQEIEYRQPLTYRNRPVFVKIWVTSVGGSSYDFGYLVAERDESTVYALGATTMVLVDRSSGAPVRLTAEQRAALEHWHGEPVPFRRRK
ncbi:thioesterase family protein [Tersicoccus sp. MR15.9]|uniref:acyl-CoA thioesterase n=1 Tax=Tersicoccus mangrovi TaxID=3121635 RepID=UPI002FE64A93